MLGEKLKKLRKERGLLQRQVATALDVDTAYISKMEKNDKPVSKSHLAKLASLYNINQKELLTLWLAEKVFDLIKDEDVALDAIDCAETEWLSRQNLMLK